METQTCCDFNNLGFTFPTKQAVQSKVAFTYAATGLQCQGHDFYESPICSWLQYGCSYSTQYIHIREGKKGKEVMSVLFIKKTKSSPRNLQADTCLYLVGLMHIVWPPSHTITKGVSKCKQFLQSKQQRHGRAKDVENDCRTIQLTAHATLCVHSDRVQKFVCRSDEYSVTPDSLYFLLPALRIF